MFALAALALAIAASTNALAIPRHAAPSTYAAGYLEPYTTYHIRYLALDCQAHQPHDQFFDDCCHPMLATETLEKNRKSYCTPSQKASSSASVAEPTSTVVPSGDDDCSDDGDESPAADPTPTPDDAPKNVAPEPSSSTSSSTSSSPSSSTSSSTSSSSSSAPEPTYTKPTTTAAPPPKPTPSPDSSSDGSGGGLSGVVGNIFKGGIATFFFQNGVPGNCGTIHQDNDFVVALETSTYAGGSHCGKKIVIKNAKTGGTQEAIVADSCPTCDNPQSIDLSQALFKSLADPSDGTFPVEWGFKSD